MKSFFKASIYFVATFTWLVVEIFKMSHFRIDFMFSMDLRKGLSGVSGMYIKSRMARHDRAYVTSITVVDSEKFRKDGCIREKNKRGMLVWIL